MAERIRLAIVGCGGMGHRHLLGLQELHRYGISDWELAVACDPVTDNAQSLAHAAGSYFGAQPAVAARLEQLPAHGVQAIDLTSPPALHHALIEDALDLGLHVMTEKPVGLTVAAALRICAAADRSACIVSVAENYRRDPVNRLARALLEAGAIGAPRLMIMNSVSGRNRLLITLWRHRKQEGGILVDMGVHYGDVMEYFMGPAQSVYGQKRLHEKRRVNPRTGQAVGDLSNPGGAYSRWQAQMPASFAPDAEDALYGTIVFANGAVAQFSEDHAGWGAPLWQRAIYGAAGSMELPPDRTGRSLVVHADGKDKIAGADLLALAPDFALDAATATLFGSERLATYDLAFEAIDRKLLATEYAEFAGAIRGEQAIEVDAWQGTRALAVIYALLESAESGAAVSVDAVLKGGVDRYQSSINDALNL